MLYYNIFRIYLYSEKVKSRYWKKEKLKNIWKFASYELLACYELGKIKDVEKRQHTKIEIINVINPDFWSIKQPK